MFSKLRHPFRSIRESFGTAGLIVACVALIAALGGTAIASGALSGAEKSLIKKEAKKWSQKFAIAGPQGAPGANGKDGAEGKQGPTGATGAAGTPGGDGKSVEVLAGAAGCGTRGGDTVQVEGEPSTAQEVCNGSPWAAGGTLPAGATETGSVAGISGTNAVSAVTTLVPISFSIPLAAALDDEHVKVIYETATVPSACENANHAGTASAANPEASSGYLCVYVAEDTSESTVHQVHKTATAGLGASTAGAYLLLSGGEAGWQFNGTWAVTG